jgi:hypothetical protein
MFVLKNFGGTLVFLNYCDGSIVILSSWNVNLARWLSTARTYGLLATLCRPDGILTLTYRRLKDSCAECGFLSLLESPLQSGSSTPKKNDNEEKRTVREWEPRPRRFGTQTTPTVFKIYTEDV